MPKFEDPQQQKQYERLLSTPPQLRRHTTAAAFWHGVAGVYSPPSKYWPTYVSWIAGRDYRKQLEEEIQILREHAGGREEGWMMCAMRTAEPCELGLANINDCLNCPRGPRRIR